ncbi:MAG: hypothetical protein M1816_003350 [Peltula sp. TS41687]|nr:MAG: hypothetical protein M1816_003350 [Peltula sp. TS41687]
MGTDAAFDMVSRLSKGAVDRQNWQSFIKIIRERYQNNDLVEVKHNSIVFKAGEHPLLPFESHKFLRFSSKVSGSHAEGVEEYINTVNRVAKVSFGSRVRYWNEAFEEWSFYNWQEVNDSFDSYEQPDEPEIPTTIAQYVFGTDPISELNLQLFDIQSVPGKGKGLIARLNIAKGKSSVETPAPEEGFGGTKSFPTTVKNWLPETGRKCFDARSCEYYVYSGVTDGWRQRRRQCPCG